MDILYLFIVKSKNYIFVHPLQFRWAWKITVDVLLTGVKEMKN